MRTVSKRELNQNTAAVLAQVTGTEDVVVTERGVPQWRIGRISSHAEDVLTRLAADGRYTPPSPEPAPWPAVPSGRAYASDEVDALLDELRGDH